MTNPGELDLEAFLEAARRPVDDPDAGKDAVRARLLEALGPASFGYRQPSPPEPSSRSTVRPARARFGWKSPLLVASGFVLGVAAHAAVGAWLGPRVPDAGRVVPSSSTSEPTPRPAPRSPKPDGVIDVESLPAASSSLAKPEAPRARVLERDDLSAERVLLETARTALERSDVVHAVDALDKHDQRFPRGQLREERESLRIGALVMAGRETEARVKVAEFHRSFPGSLQGAALDALVDGGL